MILAIKSCDMHMDRVVAQMLTFGRDFMISPFDGKNLGVPDDYEHLPHKTKAICERVLSLGDYNVFLCDTDTYVHVPRLLSSGYEQHDYIGHELLRYQASSYASGGAGYWLSRKAMEIVARCDPSEFKLEDEMVGTVLARSGIKLHHDSRYTLALDRWPEPGNDIITKHLSMNGPYKVEMMYEAHRRAHGIH